MGSPRYKQTATLLPDGEVLIAGGFNWVYLSSVELYNPGTGIWTVAESMASSRYYHTATLLLDGRVLVTGGQDSGGNLSSTELYDPGSGD